MYVGEINMMTQGHRQQQAYVTGAVIAGAIGERRPELAEYMERMATAIAMTEELSVTLAKRLEGVMRPNGPQSGEGSLNSTGPSTYYGTQLHAGIDRIAVVNGRLQEILQRLEA